MIGAKNVGQVGARYAESPCRRYIPFFSIKKADSLKNRLVVAYGLDLSNLLDGFQGIRELMNSCSGILKV